MAGKLQNEDHKSLSELTGAGGSAAQLLNDTKIYVTANSLNKQLSQAITDGDLSGGGGGSSVITDNFITLDTNFEATALDNANADVTIGAWTAFADAATAVPSGDLTGGSPNTTATRNTTTPLNGAGDIKMTKSSGASRQGEGIACVANISPKGRGKVLTFKGAFKTSGTIVDGDVIPYAYDVTNSVLIPPTVIDKIIGPGGRFYCVFPTASNTAQIRVAFYIATTATTALDLYADDVVVGLEEYPAFQTPISGWTAYTPTYTGLGTVTNSDCYYRLVGDELQVMAKFTVGTTTATEARVSFPTGFTSSATKIPSGVSVCGSLIHANAGSISNLQVYAERSVTYFTFGYRDGTQAGLSKLNGSDTFVSSTTSAFFASVALDNLNASVNVGFGEGYYISSLLASGSRVTSTPDVLGEYRTYHKSGASVITGTDSAPSTGPSANGMLIYANKNFGTAGTSGEPGRWEIFIGKNKVPQFEFYSGTGKTGWVDVRILDVVTADIYGLYTAYDPNTGVVIIDGITSSSNNTGSRFAGISFTTGGSGAGAASSCYFDIRVFDKAYVAGSAWANSEASVIQGNGNGSTNTTVRRFTSQAANIGQDITYADSATLGGSFTINKSGWYAVSYSDIGTGAGNIGITVNGSALTTSIATVTYAQGKRANASFNGDATSCSWSGYLNAGDIIRAQFNGTMTDTNAQTVMTVNRIS